MARQRIEADQSHSSDTSSSSIDLGRFDSPDGFADYAHNADLLKRNDAILELLPPGDDTWLDVGCGPGIASRALAASGRRVTSLDASRAALAAGPPHPVCASASALPFRDQSFDGVLCLEVLEHLPEPLLRAAAEELARVARRSLVIGVPHRENLARNLIACPGCGHRFNRAGHLHRFERGSLEALFPHFQAAKQWIGGPPVRDYPSSLLWLRHRVARRFSEMSGRKGNVCPACGNTRFSPFKHNPLSFMLDGANRFLSRRRPYWLVLLMTRSG